MRGLFIVTVLIAIRAKREQCRPTKVEQFFWVVLICMKVDELTVRRIFDQLGEKLVQRECETAFGN